MKQYVLEGEYGDVIADDVEGHVDGFPTQGEMTGVSEDADVPGVEALDDVHGSHRIEAHRVAGMIVHDCFDTVFF